MPKTYKDVLKMKRLNLLPSICLTFMLFSLGNSLSFLNVYPKIRMDARPSKAAGDPLMLTPYLEKGDIDTAQKLSQVSLTEKLGLRSHAGFFTVDKKLNSNLYFWYFPPISKNEDAPVLLWLQGGPGGSSLFGLFEELGPLLAKKDGFAIRKHNWALDHHLIFIDNPVGTGFSFTDRDEGYCSDENCVAVNLHQALQQFFTLFPNLRQNKFYITGESYAGKYIPALGYEIHTRNMQADKEINLKGMAIGNGYCDPVNQLDYGDYLYQHGLLDDNQLKLFLKYQNQIISDIKAKNYAEAGILLDRLMDGDISNTSYFLQYTGFTNEYNFLQASLNDDMSVFAKLLENDDARRSIHVGGLPFNDGKAVALHLIQDMLESVTPRITELLLHYPIVFYNGQLDIIVAYPLTVNFLRNLQFSGAEEYKHAKRSIWYVGHDIAGYVKKAGNLTEILVRNAGHMVPHDQPKWALDMIKTYLIGNS